MPRQRPPTPPLIWRTGLGQRQLVPRRQRQPSTPLRRPFVSVVACQLSVSAACVVNTQRNKRWRFLM